MAAHEIDVDGDRYRVTPRGDGTVDVVWLSGPHDGYGFAMHPGWSVLDDGAEPIRSTGTPSAEVVTVSIRSFRAAIDPATGFMGGTDRDAPG